MLRRFAGGQSGDFPSDPLSSNFFSFLSKFLMVVLSAKPLDDKEGSQQRYAATNSSKAETG